MSAVQAGIDRGIEGERLAWLLLALAALLVFFVGVGERQMQGTAAFYAAVSLQTAETGVWLPLHNGPSPYFLKPPLVFWLSALSMKALGPTNLAASLWPRLFGLGCVLLVGVIGRRLYGPAAGLLAAVICLANPTLIENSNTLRLDSALLFWMLLSLWAYLAPRGAWRPAVFFGGMALAVLSKGPQGLLPLALAGIHAAACGRLRAPTRAEARPWLLASVLLALPVAYVADHAARFGSHYFTTLDADANVSWVEGRLDHLLSALRHVYLAPLLRWLPFSPFMLWGLVAALRELGTQVAAERRAANGMLVVWAVGMLLILSFRESYRMRYLLLVLVPFSLLGGRQVAQLLGDRIGARALRVAAAALAVCALGLAILRPDFDRSQGMQGVAVMRQLLDAELAGRPAPVPVLLPPGTRLGGYGSQHSIRDWIAFYLGRQAREAYPEEVRGAAPGRLYFVYTDHIDSMRRDLPIRVLIHSRRAYLVESLPPES